MNSFVRRPRRRPDQRSGGGMRRPSNGGLELIDLKTLSTLLIITEIMVIEIMVQLMVRIS